MLLTLQECLDYCDLQEEEIETIAKHQHIPEIVAVELGTCLLQSSTGICVIKRYLLDDIEQAERCGQLTQAEQLHRVLDRFDAAHPTSDAGFSSGSRSRGAATPPEGPPGRPQRSPGSHAGR